MSSPRSFTAGWSPFLLSFLLGGQSLLLCTVSLGQAESCPGTRCAPPTSVLPRVPGTEALGLGSGGPWVELSKVCASLRRMRDSATWAWSTGGWLLALCLAWLCTLLASASLQSLTPTGLGEVAGPGEGLSQDTWGAGHPPSHPTAGRSLRQSQIPRS